MNTTETTTTGKATPAQTKREITKTRRALLETLELKESTVSGKILNAITRHAGTTSTRIYKGLIEDLLYMADFKLMHFISLECELGRIPTRAEIYNRACDIYGRLITPPRWMYASRLREHLLEENITLHNTEKNAIQRALNLQELDYIDHIRAAQQAHPEQFIRTTAAEENAIMTTAHRTGNTRSQVMSHLIKLAIAAGMLDQVPQANLT